MKTYYVSLTVEIQASDDDQANETADRIADNIESMINRADKCAVNSVEESEE